MRPLILFVGAGADTRARMAAAFLDHRAGDRYASLAAAPSTAAAASTSSMAATGGEVPVEVTEAMAEVDVDLARAAGASLTPRVARSAHRVIFLGAPDEHPPPISGRPERWGIPSPDGRSTEEVRVIRDTVRRLVDRLVARLDTEALVR